MVVGLSNKIIKLIIFALSFVVFLFGLAMLGVGVAGLTKMDDKILKEFTDHTDLLKKEDLEKIKDDIKSALNADVAMWVLSVIGGFMVILGFSGCAGAGCESTLLLYVFNGLLGLMMLVCIAGTILFAVKEADMWHAVEKVLKEGEKEIATKEKKRLFAKAFEERNQCCGIDKDYKEPSTQPCPIKNPKQSCFDVVQASVSGYKTAGFVLMGFIVLIMAVTALFSCTLVNAL